RHSATGTYRARAWAAIGERVENDVDAQPSSATNLPTRVPRPHHRGQGEREGRALSRSRVDPNPPPMLLDDAAHDREADAGSRVVALGVEAPTEFEDLVEVPRIDADPIVADGEAYLVVQRLRRDDDLGD